MFPRAERLGRRRDIERVLKTGRRVSAPELLLRVLPNRVGHVRATVVVGTVVSKSAVIRNRLKRQLRHILRAELPKTAIGVDLMISTKAAALKLEKDQKIALVRSLLKRARIA